MRVPGLILVLALGVTSTTWASDFEDGLDAYNRNDYLVTLQKFRKAAAKGRG